MEDDLSAAQQAEVISKLSGKETELKDVEAQLEALTCQRQTLVSEIFNLRAQVCPIRRVHRDILAEIFLRCLPATRYPSMSLSEAPLIFGQVCRSWRELSRTTPALWDSIQIVVPTHPEEAAHASNLKEAAVREWLSRAGVRGLSIRFTSRQSVAGVAMVHPEAMPYAMRMLRVLKEFAGSWKSFAITFNWDVMVDALQGSSSRTDVGTNEEVAVETLTPRLEDIEYATLRLSGEDNQPRNFVFPSSLRRVTVRGPLRAPLSLPLPWGSLTHLKLLSHTHSGIPQISALELLRRCPKLKACSISVFDFDFTNHHMDPAAVFNSGQNNLPTSMTLESVTLAELHSLEVTTLSNDHVNVMFEHLTLPSIRNITYRASPVHMHPLANQQPPALLPLPVTVLLRHSLSTPPLDSLSLRVPLENLWVNMFPLVLDYLKLCTKLRRLHIDGISPDMLTELVPSCRRIGVQELRVDIIAPPPPHTPGGHNTHFFGASTMSFETSQLTNFLDALTNPEPDEAGEGAKLKKMQFMMTMPVPSKQETQLNAYAQALKEKGVKCIFKFPPKYKPRSGAHVVEAAADGDGFWGYDTVAHFYI